MSVLRLYELANVKGECISPFVWRVKFALQLKELDYARTPVSFFGIPQRDRAREAEDGPCNRIQWMGSGLLGVGLRQAFEHLLLAGVLAIGCERHDLIEREVVGGVDVEQLGRHRRQLQPLPHDRDRNEERGGDLSGLALFAQGQERAELIERMERRPLNILGELVLSGDAALAHNARHGRGLGEPPLLLTSNSSAR